MWIAHLPHSSFLIHKPCKTLILRHPSIGPPMHRIPKLKYRWSWWWSILMPKKEEPRSLIPFLDLNVKSRKCSSRYLLPLFSFLPPSTKFPIFTILLTTNFIASRCNPDSPFRKLMTKSGRKNDSWKNISYPSYCNINRLWRGWLYCILFSIIKKHKAIVRRSGHVS